MFFVWPGTPLLKAHILPEINIFMEFDIDVSGEDLLSKDYTICIASKNIIRGFKFTKELVYIINTRYGENKYKYEKSQQGKANLKVRIYSIVIYYLFKSINLPRNELCLIICRDFDGKENEIRANLQYFLEQLLKYNLEIYFEKLKSSSKAHIFAKAMRFDIKNKINYYTKINLNEIEFFLK